jgi:hypothetical protein
MDPVQLFPDEPAAAAPRRIVHTKWREAADAVYIGRPGRFANPFMLDDPTDAVARHRVVEQYRLWFAEKVAVDPSFVAALETLRGRTLACWCPTRAEPERRCHGDVILDWLDNNPAQTR